MLARRSAAGSLVQTPSGPRKSGIPEAVETPAPVITTIDDEVSTSDRALSKELEVTRANSTSKASVSVMNSTSSNLSTYWCRRPDATDLLPTPGGLNRRGHDWYRRRDARDLPACAGYLVSHANFEHDSTPTWNFMPCRSEDSPV